MLSSISMYVRMLDGRDRGLVLDMNREIALPLIASGGALAIEDVTAKDALEPWDQDRLTKFLQSRKQVETKVPIVQVDEVKVRAGDAEVVLPTASVEVPTRTKVKTVKR